MGGDFLGEWGNEAKMCSWLLSPEGVRLHIGRKGKSIEGIRDGKITNEYTVWVRTPPALPSAPFAGDMSSKNRDYWAIGTQQGVCRYV
jgi:hypothetical protein